jgi:hypothetical protein
LVHVTAPHGTPEILRLHVGAGRPFLVQGRGGRVSRRYMIGKRFDTSGDRPRACAKMGLPDPSLLARKPGASCCAAGTRSVQVP